MAISSDSIPGPEGDSIVSARAKRLYVEREMLIKLNESV